MRAPLPALAAAAMLAALTCGSCAPGEGRTGFRPVPTQFIAALADPAARSGDNAQSWGLWPVDPGPRGVRLSSVARLRSAGGVTPAQWTFDDAEWWLEEHGLLMEKPEFPLAPGKYLVTGDREVTTVLTVHPAAPGGAQRWELGDGATVFDVTHLACRSARYTQTERSACSPEQANPDEFPVAPGAAMPPVPGCEKQDYAVLFVIGVAED